MKHEIIFIDEVAKRIGMSVSWVNREHAKSIRGESNFPQKISSPKCKGRWLANDVDNYIASLSKVNDSTTIPTKSQKQQEREFNERQKRAKAALARHSRNKNEGV